MPREVLREAAIAKGRKRTVKYVKVFGKGGHKGIKIYESFIFKNKS